VSEENLSLDKLNGAGASGEPGQDSIKLPPPVSSSSREGSSRVKSDQISDTKAEPEVRSRSVRRSRGRVRGQKGANDNVQVSDSNDQESKVPLAGKVPVPQGIEAKPKIGDTRPAPPPPSEATRRKRKYLRTKADSDVVVPEGPIEYNIEGKLADSLEKGPRGKRRLNQRAPRQRKGRPIGRYLMCVHVKGGASQIAILEGRTLIEHYVSREADDQYNIDGNIYLGRVANVLPGMEAAFIDIGTSKNAVIYRGDVRFDRDDIEVGDRSVRIEHLLRPKQTVICQVVKNPIGAKGARLTQEVSLPGRFVVLIPHSDSYGISKRLPEEERRRLRRILDEIKPPGFGMIVRTAAEGASAEELSRDLTRLTEMWEKIDQMARTVHAPALLYREPKVALRVIREEFNRNYRGVIIDDQSMYEEVVSYVSAISPELADRVEYYDPNENLVPLFEAYHVHEQLHKALGRKVWLPSGGSIVIDRAEALTVIDVNTAKNVGTVSLEETIHRNNLEAVEEIAHQLRLRDIGGIIVIDFIDMLIKENRDDVMRAFRAALARDKTKSHVYDMSPLGLVEMTRQRVSEGLVEAFSQTCPTCEGRGLIFDQELL
jgi:ribonuclease E